MKLAVFGGTGFLGYDFIKAAMKLPDIELVVYSTGPGSLVNIARHELDVRLLSVSQLESLELDSDTDFIVNFSHPFGLRDGLNSRDQLKLFVGLVDREKRRLRKLRLIHLSTMSVYEPFGTNIRFEETGRVKTPRTDQYATDKAYVEKALRSLDESEAWQLHLRPTIVYGPFCRPWTDRVMEALAKGDIAYSDLSGRMQPVYGADISRFLVSMLLRYEPGVYNISGAEEVSWEDYLKFYESIVECGSLHFDSNVKPVEFGPSVNLWRFYRDNLRELVGVMINEPSFERMASPVLRRLSRRFVVWVRDKMPGFGMPSYSSPPAESFFSSQFFAEDRLVNRDAFANKFPDFEFTAMSETREELTSYYQFRFTDKPIL